MPTNSATKAPFLTYYFRTHFSLPANAQPISLIFSNYIDDGAVFYLNGTEIYRENMAAPPTLISNLSIATASNCGGDATCTVVFAVSGNLLTNLVPGDNVLAVEVHNASAKGSDVTFGSALSYSHPFTPVPELQVLRSGNAVTIYWNGAGFTLQQADELNSTTDWLDVPGPVTSSPYFLDGTTPISRSRFYRLRQ